MAIERHLTLIKGERDQQRGFLSLSEAAAWAGVSKRTVRRWIGRGMPYFQGSERGKVLIRPGDIETFLNRKQATQVDLSAMVNEVFNTLTKKGAA